MMKHAITLIVVIAFVCGYASRPTIDGLRYGYPCAMPCKCGMVFVQTPVECKKVSATMEMNGRYLAFSDDDTYVQIDREMFVFMVPEIETELYAVNWQHWKPPLNESQFVLNR